MAVDDSREMITLINKTSLSFVRSHLYGWVFACDTGYLEQGYDRAVAGELEVALVVAKPLFAVPCRWLAMSIKAKKEPQYVN